MKQKAKSLWSAFWKNFVWIWLLISFSMMGWNYVSDARENRAHAQQMRSIVALETELSDVDKKVDALINKKPWTKADDDQLRDLRLQLKSLRLRANNIRRNYKS